MIEADALADIVRRGRQDGAWFIETLFGEELWSAQREIASSVLNAEHSRTSVRSAHSTGKTFLSARIALAFSMLHPDSRVLTTAPTFRQVQSLLWTEIRQAYSRLPDMGAVVNLTDLTWSDKHFMLGLSTDNADRFVGHHSDYLLLVFDEAPGVRSEIWEASMGLLAGGDARMLAIGNPTESAGPFYEAFTSQSDRWSNFHIDAMDTPNLEGVAYAEDGTKLSDEEIVDKLAAMSTEELNADPYPFLTTRRWVLEAAQTFGIGSSPWLSRVKGEFPLESDDALVSLRWIESSINRWRDEAGTLTWLATLDEDDAAHADTDDTDWQIGVDVAGPGSDSTVVVVRQGRRIVDVRSWQKSDPRGEVLSMLDEYRKYGPLVVVDSAGLGHYFLAALKDAGHKVIGINVGKVPQDKKRFANLKAELQWDLRLQLSERKLDLPDDREMTAQISAVKYLLTPQGKVAIESKDQAKRRGIKSPDKWDALVLAAARSASIRAARRRGAAGKVSGIVL